MRNHNRSGMFQRGIRSGYRHQIGARNQPKVVCSSHVRLFVMAEFFGFRASRDDIEDANTPTMLGPDVNQARLANPEQALHFGEDRALIGDAVSSEVGQYSPPSTMHYALTTQSYVNFCQSPGTSSGGRGRLNR